MINSFKKLSTAAKIALLIILLCGAIKNDIKAQNIQQDEADKKFLFSCIKIDISAGLPRNIADAIQLEFTNNYFAGADFNLVNVNAHLPSDYKEGLCLFGNCVPKKELTITSIFIGKGINETSRFKINFKAGISFVHQSKPLFTPYDSGFGLDLSSNYTTAYELKNTIGMMLTVQQEWMASKTISLQLSGRANINSIRSLLCVNAGIGFNFFKRKAGNRKG